MTTNPKAELESDAEMYRANAEEFQRIALGHQAVLREVEKVADRLESYAKHAMDDGDERRRVAYGESAAQIRAALGVDR